MIYAIHNTAASPRAFYDTRYQEITLAPGVMKYVDIDQGTLDRLLARDDLVLTPATFERHAPIRAAEPVAPGMARPAIVVTGHFGIGDNLHQRAVMRMLMRDYDVWLHTCHFELFHDLVERGLKLILRPTNLHAQAKTIARERNLFEEAKFPAPPAGARQANIGYPAVLVHQHGSILEAMFSCVGLKMPERPDFSLPIKPEWCNAVREKYLSQWNTGGKPLLVYRPIVVRREWDGRSRNPDPNAYRELFNAIRDQFFVVSVADLANGREWVDGPPQSMDIALHAGELSFPEMAALFSESSLVFCNAGFAPVLAQAVGTPLIVVYGGRESYRTTQRVGAHLAPTCPIDPIKPCDCHSANHACDKRIDVPAALHHVKQFAADRLCRTLVFGTFYIDSPDRDGLTDLWKTLHLALNPDCDFLAVDSASPIRKFADWAPYDGQRHHRMYFDFGDNIGHLSRPKVTQGRDGWGRAFCKGLEIACELGYEHVVHVEGDSLFRLKVVEITAQMRRENIDCASTQVHGMRHQEHERMWVETGLMFFSTDYIKRSNFIARYDWPNRRREPTPERYIRMQILDRDKSLRLMPWKALRADKSQITKDNIAGLDLDWVTHQHDSAQQDVYKKFVEAALARELLKPCRAVPERASTPQENTLCRVQDVKNAANGSSKTSADPSKSTTPKPSELLRLNLGCGSNKLSGWQNCDADVDITKPLPWPSNSASHINAEHVVEHVGHKLAIEFFKEAHRILAPGGVLRVTVPSLERIAACDDEAYWRFTTKFQNVGPTKRGAMHSIIYCHGHECAWNAQLMRDTLFFAGFDDVRPAEVGQSDDPMLRGVEGHGRVIGDRFNRIESCTHEARKAGELSAIASNCRLTTDPSCAVAVVVGGAACWKDDLEKAKKLIGDHPIRYFIINDHIQTFPERAVACTLHPDKLNGHFSWLVKRLRAGLPEPEQVWAHRRASSVTHDTASKDWGGSSGLFAVQVARREGHQKIIACGIPMTVDGGHYLRGAKWQSAITFRSGWVRCRNEIAPQFRSMSGWTAEQFGEPDENWINS